MPARIGIFLCFVAILQIAGGHWALLKTTALIGMAVEYSQSEGICNGLIHTFDGLHPCAMCKAISKGSKQEKDNRSLLQLRLKQTLAVTVNSFTIHVNCGYRTYPEDIMQSDSSSQEPRVPPPRIA